MASRYWPATCEKIGIFRNDYESLDDWSTMLTATAAILKYIRNHGYHSEAADDLVAEALQGSDVAELPLG